jgi:hypothetical protein
MVTSEIPQLGATMLEEKLEKLNVSLERLNDLLAATLAKTVPPTAIKPVSVVEESGEDAPKKKRGRPAKVLQINSTSDTTVEEAVEDTIEDSVEEAPQEEVAETEPEVVDAEDEDDDFLMEEAPKKKPAVVVTAQDLRVTLKELRDKDRKLLESLMVKYKAKAFSDLKEEDYADIQRKAKDLIGG